MRLPRSDGFGELGDAKLPRPHDQQNSFQIKRTFLQLLSVVKRECCTPGQPLVLNIDGVDELVRTQSFADSAQPDLLKYLPTASELPEGVFVVLTRRPSSLPDGVRQMLEELAPESERVRVELTSEQDAAAQETVIHTFVTQSLMKLWPNSPTDQRDELTAAILERAARQFLKATLLIDTFRWQSDIADLPSPTSLPGSEFIFGTAGGVMNAPSTAEAAGQQRSTAATPDQAVSAQWRNWVNSLIRWLRRSFAIRGVNFSGNGQFCTITMSQGRQNYVCEVNNFTYTIRATR